MIEVFEECPECGCENEINAQDDQLTARCSECGKVIVLCDKCVTEHPNVEDRKCGDCILCDLANFMNYLKGDITIDEFLGAMNPPLTDMTSGLAEGQESTYANYINDAFGDDVLWDVKYWGIYTTIKECFLDANSNEKDVLDFVKEIVKKNKE